MLTKENVLAKTSSYHILAYYLQPYHNEERLLQGLNINNPFLPHKQATPSFNIFCALPQHEWCYKDFATGDEGSCFDFVMKLFNLDFSQALLRINQDFSLGLADKQTTVSFKTAAPVLSSVETATFKIAKRKFTTAELAFWNRYGIHEQTLSKYNVCSLSEFTANNKEGKAYTVKSAVDKFIFCYDNKSWMKLYKPLDEKKYRFQYLGIKEPGYLFGFNQLPAIGDTVFLTGGEKDVLSLSAKGFSAFTLNSETAGIDAELVSTIKQRFKNFVVLYDNDDTGLKQSELLCKEHKLKRIVLPAIQNGKDISDFFASGKTSDDLKSLLATVLKDDSIIEEEKLVYNAVELLQLGQSEPQYLMEPILPRKGTAVLAGKPDTGKSQIARQLCIQVASGLQDFIGFKLQPIHNKALYVATEDGIEASTFLLQKQLNGLGKQATKNLRFLFADTLEQEDILKLIDATLIEMPADLVVVDSFGDIFKGNDSNNNMAMRNTVKAFDRIAKKNNCLILFVHHINKGAYKQAPGQEHIQGGAGLVQKVRLAIQLTQGEGFLKHFTVVKGNYCPREYKANAIELEFSEENFLFKSTGNLIPIEQLGEQPYEKADKEVKYQELLNMADEIFGDQILSYSQFSKAYCQATGKSVPTAKRNHAHLVKLEIVIPCQGGYRLANYAFDDESEPD